MHNLFIFFKILSIFSNIFKIFPIFSSAPPPKKNKRKYTCGRVGMINDYLKKSASVWKFSLPNLDIKPSPIQLREPFQDNKIGENHFLGSWAPGAEISKKGGGVAESPFLPPYRKSQIRARNEKG